MQLRILGCSGGIGGTLQTTSMLVDRDVLIDAGTG
ncbi:MAG: 3',5'-cyclic-nucleotide phosphodiesterase, partial [Burkholderiales bacterium]